MGTNGFTTEPSVRAFCSYVHKDNENFGTAVEYLVEDIRALHEAETGRTLQIFFDRADIGWGQDFRNAISDSVENATFFIPVITARYFQSEYCRDELLSFYGKCRNLGVTELILPIILAGASQIRSDSDDEVVRIVARIQYIDWSNIWPAGRDSSAWKIGVMHLVRRLVDLEERVESHLARKLAESAKQGNDGANGRSRDSAPMALGEISDADKHGQSVLDQVREVSEKIARILADFNAEFGKGLGGLEDVDDYQVRSTLDRLGVRYATRAHQAAQEARSVLDDLVEYDARVRAVVRARRQLANREGQVSVDKQVAGLQEAALGLGDTIHRVDDMSNGLDRYSNISVSLRVALSPTRAAIQALRDMARILDGWLAIEY
jgi:hypothetical protein